MKKTVKIILKIFLIMLCVFIVFEVCGAIVNIIYVQSQTKKVLEIAENNGGDIWDSYSCFTYNRYEKIFADTIVIVYSENIDEISSELKTEFKKMCEIHPLKLVGWTDVGIPSFELYWDKIDFETNHDKENYYVIGIWHNAPFKYNIISYIIFRITFKN